MLEASMKYFLVQSLFLSFTLVIVKHSTGFSEKLLATSVHCKVVEEKKKHSLRKQWR